MFPFLERCLGDSTMHGIPRMLNARVNNVRILWFFLTLGCTAVFIYHSSTLIMQYINEPTSVSMKPAGTSFTVPDIHFCNEYVLANSYMVLDATQPTVAGKRINEIKHRIRNILNETATALFYESVWQTIPTHLLNSAFGHRINQMLTSIFGPDGKLRIENVPESLPHWRHMSCFRYRPDPADFNVVDKKITFFLYTDSSHDITSNMSFGYIPFTDIDFTGVPQPDKSSGIAMYFTPPGHYPHMDATRVVAAPGFKTSISLSMERFDLVSKSSHLCETEVKNISYRNMLIEAPTMIEYEGYGYSDCINEKFHLMTLELCNCVVHYYPLTQAVLDKNPTFCFNLTLLGKASDYKFTVNLNNTLKKRVKCVEDALNKLSSMSSQCLEKTPCKRNKYKADWTMSRWTLSTSYMAMFTKMLLRMYKYRKSLSNESFPGWEEYIPDVSDKDYIKARENFAKVVINTAEVNSTLFLEDYTYNVRNIASDMGGLLGFYLGMSVLTVCEIFEMLLLLVFVNKPRHEVEQDEATRKERLKSAPPAEAAVSKKKSGQDRKNADMNGNGIANGKQDTGNRKESPTVVMAFTNADIVDDEELYHSTCTYIP